MRVKLPFFPRLIKMKKLVEYKIHFGRFKAFLDHAFFQGGGNVGPYPKRKIPFLQCLASTST